ncbi:LacI family DNA-binding transcriptional regulator [Actinophytocola sp.]|uniref:LacI family DNA-binding transcriptional regulator n=1 Tax=Actinophytocola sp. TaxID=1872138 RepID=UPI003899CD44
MGKRVTIADIARAAGVSKGAVSYALNGQPGVSEATRERILQIAAELGFTPSRGTRPPSGSGAVGLVLCRPPRILGVEPFFMELISGIEAALSASSCDLTLHVVADHGAELEVYERWATQRRVDGVFLVDVRVADERLDAVRRLELPAVAIAGPGDFGGITSVWSDDAAAITDAVEYLAALGHRTIARVGGLPHLLHTVIRTEAFAAACRRLDVQHAVTVPSDYSGEEGGRATRRLLSSTERPTAIIYDNDIMAVAGLGVAHEMDLSVPRDLSIVAWGDSLLCSAVHPPLTALSRDVAAYGSVAAQHLLTVMAEGTVPSRQHATAFLVPRGSTARPSQVLADTIR